MKTSIFLTLFILHLAWNPASAQQLSTLVEDESLRGAVIKTLEETWGLRGEGRNLYDLRKAYIMVTRESMDATSPIISLRAICEGGRDLGGQRGQLDMPDEAEGVKRMIGSDLYSSLDGRGRLLGRRVDAENIVREFSILDCRDLEWWTRSYSFEAASDRIHARFMDNFALSFQMGDPYLGLPGNLAGWSTIGMGSRSFRAGVVVPVNARLLTSEPTKLASSLGGFGQFRVTEGAIGAGGRGYFQVHENEQLVNYDNPESILLSKWGGYGYFDFFFNVGNSGAALQAVLGGGAYNIYRGQVSGDNIVDQPVALDGSPTNVDETVPVFIGYLRFFYPARTTGGRVASCGQDFKRWDVSAGYSGTAVFASVTLFPDMFHGYVGFNLQSHFFSSPEEWQPSTYISFSPILRIGLI